MFVVVVVVVVVVVAAAAAVVAIVFVCFSWLCVISVYCYIMLFRFGINNTQCIV